VTGVGPAPATFQPPREPTQVRFRDTERRWLVPTLLMVLVAVSLGVAGLLISRSGSSLLDDDGSGGDDQQEAQTGPQALQLAEPGDFDPFGEGGTDEHPDEVPLAVDGNPESAWTTENYNQPDLVPYKTGVGMYVTLAETASVAQVDIETASEGWAVEIYVADEPASNLDGWGSPVGQLSDGTAGTNSVELDQPTEGRAVLLWFTHVSRQANDRGQYQMDVAEVRVLG
jgi:hypothetical protein